MKILREIGIPIVIAIAISIPLHLTIQTCIVDGSSMEPNFHDGERIVVSKASYFFSDPQRGDVIILNPPFESPRPFIKRVIGLPGDIVEIKDGKVSINGTPLGEEYIMAPPNYTMPATEVPENEYFVLGDNRNISTDSHYGWTVLRDNIIGKAWFIYWPPSRWGIVKHYSYEVGEQGIMVSQPFEVQFE